MLENVEPVVRPALGERHRGRPARQVQPR
jgi:hypothetical protein